MKPGRSKQEFLQTLEKHFASLLPRYEKLYGDEDKYGNLDVDQPKKMGLVRPEIKGYTLGYEYRLPCTAKRYIPNGRVKTNLQTSEILQKIAYVTSCILQNSWSKVRKFSQAAKFLENFQQAVSKLKTEELKKLHIAKKIHP